MTFAEFINEKRNDPFEWGRNDCLTFVSRALMLLGRRSLPDDWTTGYAPSIVGVAKHHVKMTKSLGFLNVIEALDDLYGRDVVLNPKSGSIVARKTDGILGYGFGVVYNGVCLFMTEDGLKEAPTEPTDLFWDTR